MLLPSGQLANYTLGRVECEYALRAMAAYGAKLPMSDRATFGRSCP
jgi:hypothetical protein